MNEEKKKRTTTREDAGPPKRLSGRAVVIWIALLAVLLFVMSEYLSRPSGTRLAYTEFKTQIQNGSVTRVTVQGDRITGQLKTGTQEGDQSGPLFYTYLPSFDDPELMSQLSRHDVAVHTAPADGGAHWTPILFMVFPVLMLVGLGLLLFRGVGGQGKQMFNIGVSKAKLYDRRKEKTTFADVAGVEAAKNELKEVVDYLKSPKRFTSVGARLPHGILLVGPPGTGKTLLARAVAGEANVPFFSITGSDFMEMFVGVGASRVRNMFEDAKKRAPSIIFIDEIDSIGRRRGAGLGGGHDEREQTLNQLLSELDGFESSESVIVMAATNRPDILDHALMRPGRFDRQVTVDLPTLNGRRDILEIHARNIPLEPDVDLHRVAQSTPGFSGADLKNLLNEAALQASRSRRDRIAKTDLDTARDKVLMGLVREGMTISPEELRIIACHEAGHAVAAALMAGADPIHKVSIVPRGRSLGATEQLPETERYLQQQRLLEDRLVVMLSGRSAEMISLGTVTSGAEDDLKQATRIARRMVLNWGMSEALGPVAYGDDRNNVFLGEEISHRREFSEATAQMVDTQIKTILEEAMKRGKALLNENRAALDRITEELIEKETISGDRVLEIVAMEQERRQPAAPEDRGGDRVLEDQEEVIPLR